MSSTGSSNPRKGTGGKASSKLSKAEFERVISSLEKENEALQTPSSQILLFYLVGTLVASAPVVLFATSVFGGDVRGNAVWYGALVFVAGLILSYCYNAVATSSRKALIISREPLAKGPQAVQQLQQVLGQQSACYALYSINLIYLVSFMSCVWYILPAQELSEELNFAIASLGSVAFVATAVSVRAV